MKLFLTVLFVMVGCVAGCKANGDNGAATSDAGSPTPITPKDSSTTPATTQYLHQRLVSADGATLYARDCDVDGVTGAPVGTCAFGAGSAVSVPGVGATTVKNGYAYSTVTNGTRYLHQRLVSTDGTQVYSRSCTLSSEGSVTGTCDFSAFGVAAYGIAGLTSTRGGWAYTHSASGKTYLHQRLLNAAGTGYYVRDCEVDTTTGQPVGTCDFGSEISATSFAIGGVTAVRDGYAYTTTQSGITYLHQRIFSDDGTNVFDRDCTLDSSGAINGLCNFGAARSVSSYGISGLTEVSGGYAFE